MCATPLSTSQVTSSVSTTPVPKWLKMKQQNKSSAGKTAKPTVNSGTAKQSSSAQKPNEGTREEKRARWAKKAVPKQKPSVRKEPLHEYITACCSVPARKPVAGQKEMTKDAETGKMKDKPKGLGKWRCTACGKVAKVTPRKPEPKGEVRAVKGADLGRGTEVPNATS